MREIKFRIWDKEKKVFLPLENDKDNTVVIAPLMDACGRLYCWGSQHWGTDNELENQDDYIIQQFIGLKDKKGRNIYEGDIVKFDRYDQLAVVGWDKSYSSFCFEFEDLSKKKKKKVTREPITNEKPNFEIIGNVLENSNLIKK